MATIRESEVSEATRAHAQKLYEAYSNNEIDPASLQRPWAELSEIKRSNWCAVALAMQEGAVVEPDAKFDTSDRMAKPSDLQPRQLRNQGMTMCVCETSSPRSGVCSNCGGCV